jgi:colanic acid/amylovoran biosynthesis protein
MTTEANQIAGTAAEPLTVGLLWHSSNSPNLGVGALTVSNIAIVEKVAAEIGIAVSFKVLQWNDPEPVYVTDDNVEVVRLRGRHVLFHPHLLSKLRQCDLVLDISGGDSFADIYGARRFAFNALGKASVLASRRPLVMSPQTVGPFSRGWAKQLAGLFMRASRMPW